MLRLPFLFLLLARVTSFSVSAAQPVVYTGEGQTGPLGMYMGILEDPSGELGVADAINGIFLRGDGGEIPDLGLSLSAYWIRLKVENRSMADRMVVHLGNPEIDELDIHLQREGLLLHIAHAGHARPVNKSLQVSPEQAFTIPLPRGETGTLFIRVRSMKTLQVPLSLRSTKDLLQGSRDRNIFIGGYIGIMLVMALYNLFIFLSTRDRSYLWYVVYILLVCVAQLSFLGYGAYYFWPDQPWLSARSSLIFTVLTAIAASEFMRHFVETDRYMPSFIRISRPVYLLFAAGLLLSIIDLPLEAYTTVQVISAGFASFLLYSAYRISRMGSRPARFFLFAWSLFLGGIMLFVLKDWGLLPYNGLTRFTMPVGSVAEVVLLSFGLADRINILRKEKELSQAKALEASQENERIIREQNVMLEDKVRERTLALQESNEDLKRTQTQLVNAEKMASVGQLTAGIAHEINNPINFITSNILPLRRNITDLVEMIGAYRALDPGRADAMLAELRAKEEHIGLEETIAELDDIIASISEGSARTAEIVRGLRNFSRLDEDDLKEADVNEGIRSTLTVLSPQYRDRVKFDLDLGEIPRVECFPGKVNQVLMNVLTNAVQATLARTDLSDRRVWVHTSFDATHIHVQIKDNGIGMNEEVRKRIFEPFFTTKPVGEGTGLGMAIVYGIIQDHHGQIQVESMPGAGTEFLITLPLRQPNDARKRA